VLITVLREQHQFCPSNQLFLFSWSLFTTEGGDVHPYDLLENSSRY